VRYNTLLQLSLVFCYFLKLLLGVAEHVTLTLLTLTARFFADDYWKTGWRFFNRETPGFCDTIYEIMEVKLGITDPVFRSKCYEIVVKWIEDKARSLKNAAVSPYRESLKKCM